MRLVKAGGERIMQYYPPLDGRTEALRSDPRAAENALLTWEHGRDRGEDRTMTERDQSRDRPGDAMVRVNVAEAADRLGISEAVVRKRIQRDQMPHERGDDGQVFVWISPGETRHAKTRDKPEEPREQSRIELVEELRDRVASLERQVEEEREARRRADTILAQLSRANEEQARTIRALEAPVAEPPGAPETGADATDRGNVPGDHSEAQESRVARLEVWEIRLLVVLIAIVTLSALLYLAVTVLSS
jgi:hypothetical protein